MPTSSSLFRFALALRHVDWQRDQQADDEQHQQTQYRQSSAAGAGDDRAEQERADPTGGPAGSSIGEKPYKPEWNQSSTHSAAFPNMLRWPYGPAPLGKLSTRTT